MHIGKSSSSSYKLQVDSASIRCNDTSFRHVLTKKGVREMPRELYLALGDSITAGYDATSPGAAFVSKVSRYARVQGIASRTLIVAKNGWTSRDLVQTLWTIPPQVWSEVGLLTLCIGGNDLRRLARDMVLGTPITWPRVISITEEYEQNLRRMCDFIDRRKVPQVFLVTIYNPVPRTEIAVKAVEKLNAAIEEVAALYNFPVIDLYKAFQGREAEFIAGFRAGQIEDLMRLFKRPIHPNDSGHQMIATLVHQQLSTAQKTMTSDIKRN